MSHHTYRGEAREIRATGYYVTSRVRCAARLARITDLSIYEAAQAFGVTAGGVWNAWARLYPELPQPTSPRRQRPTCSACGERGHLAVHGNCSPSQLALKLVASGDTVRIAADRVGVSTATVYAAREQRRRAA